MEWETFLMKMQEEVHRQAGEETCVSALEVTKNNGVHLHGLSIREGSSNVSPTIYLDTLYEEFLNGKTLEYLAGRVVALYHAHRLKTPVDMDFFLRYETVRQRIVYKLINYEKNRELLQEVPHMRFLDLAVVFGCRLEQQEFGRAFILIRNSHLTMWHTDLKRLAADAGENTPRLCPARIMSMEEAVAQILEEEGAESEEVFPGPSSARGAMYVLSSRERANGAACILYPKLLQEFSRKCGSSLYILPSSVHEVILVPVNAGGRPEELAAMVREVNATEVGPEEVLSDSVYLYPLCGKQIQKIS